MKPHLQARLTLPVSIVSISLLITAGASAWYVRHLQQTVSGPIASSIASVRAAQELEISIREMLTQLNRYLITGERKHLEPIPRMRERTATALEQAENAATTVNERNLMRRTREGYEQFTIEYDRLLAEPPAQGLYMRIIELTDTVLTRQILDPAHDYLKMNEMALTEVSIENSHLANRITVALIALAVCGAGGGVLAGWVIASAVRKTMERTEEWVRETTTQLDLAIPTAPESIPAQPLAVDPFKRMSGSVSAVLNRLKESERNALRAEQLAWVGQMAAGLAHEVRNPLMAIKLLVQAAADRRSSGRFNSRDLQVLEEEIVRLEQIVSGFLDFARPSRPSARTVDLINEVGRTIDGVRARADLQAVSIDFQHASMVPLVQADPNQLRQVVFNLLFNALDAQPQGGRIQVSIEVSTDRKYLAVAVADEGTGLPVELGDRIFEPFVSTKESGMGLGLSICRRIAESHGGTLEASNRPEGGAVFTLKLPVSGLASLEAPVKVLSTNSR